MKTELVLIPVSEIKAIFVEALNDFENRRISDEKDKQQKETLFTVNEVAKRLRRAHSTIKKLIAQGILRTTSDGLISEKAINDYLCNA